MGAIQQALEARVKNLYRPGVQVELFGTKNVQLDGRVGVVLKVNPKRVTVGLGEKGQWGSYEQEFNVPLTMLRVVR